MMKKSRGTRLAAAALATVGVASGISAIAPAAANADVYYGAIAVGTNGAWGRALDYGSRATAERVALSYCNGRCKVLASFSNGCGAVADAGRSFWGATGSTLYSAQSRALSHGGYIYTWACTTR